jgi:hypothetical protein
MFNSPKLLTDSTMARRLRVTVRWLRAEADAGRIPCLKAEGRYLFAPDAVEHALLERAATERQGATDAR